MWVEVETYFLPMLCAVTQAVLQSGGVGVGAGFLAGTIYLWGA